MIRQRRLDNEWALLLDMVGRNEQLSEPGRESGVTEDVFRVHLGETTGLRGSDAGLEKVGVHRVTIRFPHYFPGLPMEVFLAEPLFHPNIDPKTGFVCLWNRHWAGDSVVEALSRLQQVIAWKLHNAENEHVMQPDALEWVEDGHARVALPLSYRPVALPAGFEEIPSRRPGVPQRPSRRRRLFAATDR